ncbi:MAG: transcription-repair coupling factor, partial [Eubacterium sp.]|nr:transcription-repair coupling factor [Eubacterium sp.]
ELYAARQNREGFAYGQDTIWQREFEEMFPFEETEDQLAAIEATKRDMESKKIMDRLICGDVGFGKTEIAIRAAFKAIQDGKQVAYLVPTTILAQQHYNTFAQRMKDFPVQVDLLCRFRTTKEQKQTIEDLKRGMADVVIGTHRLLSQDVSFKNLGLLIIDEEQRFGVTHKEKIKQMKKDVDVLTLTATPIPRTLHMSLIGIRDMSVLEEAPNDRMPVQTYVMEYDEEMVREAIERELARGGQVYYVFNKVNQIVDMTAKIAALVPKASVAFAHGQMKERELEDIMYQFINGEIDVLVSTTIIETGLDISNANTMIIHDADNLGLSQLYQLRGRIGRSNRTSYAFLMYRRNKLLREVAEKRLSAIREFSELGSGFKIAMKDLEIRGAGNLLGAQQHGHMEAVGYDLYCKMLNTAVKSLKGETVVPTFDTTLELDVDAYIPTTYIQNESQKLDVYKRIACIESEEERSEMLDELIDRFGEPPKTVETLLEIAVLKAHAHRLYLTEISEKGNQIRFVLYEKADVNVAKIPEIVQLFRPYLNFRMDAKNPYFVYDKKKGSPNTMTVVLSFLKVMEEQILNS